MNIEHYEEYGYTIAKELVDVKFCHAIVREAEEVFQLQVEAKEYSSREELFEKDYNVWLNCAKHCQWLISLHHLGVMVGYRGIPLMDSPLLSICTRPVLYFNNKNTAKKEEHHTIGPHQDWKSMQPSSDALVAWLPLIPVDDDLGKLEVVPKSHKLGDVATDIEDGFGYVEGDYEYETINIDPGDVLFFNPLLIHKSGELKSDKTRWSCHYRFNNMKDKDFIDRNYPHPYIYKPIKL